MLRLTVSLSLLGLLSTLGQAQSNAYLVDTTIDELFSVDLTTGAATSIASVANNGLETAADLAWRESTQEMWTVDLSGGEAGTIDLTTGTFTPLFQTGLSGWQGMAWDETTQVFFLANQDDNTYVLDPATGTTTLLGNSGFGLITALDVDANGTVWGIDFSTTDIVRIDKITGAGTSVARCITGIQGLGIDPNGTWYGSSTNTDSLHIIDPATGATTLVGAHGGNVTFAKGFEITGPPCSGTIVRRGQGCTDSTGTTLLMQSNGVPCAGQTLDLASNAQGGVSYFIAVGVSDVIWNSLVLPLDLTPFGAPNCSVYASQEALIGPVPLGQRLAVPIPMAPFVVGATFHTQSWVLDPAIMNPLPIGSSDMLSITLGQ